MSLNVFIPHREAKTLKDRENAWDAIERLAILNPHVGKLTSPHKAFKQSMLSQLSPISATDNGTPTLEEIGTQAKVCYKWVWLLYGCGLYLYC